MCFTSSVLPSFFITSFTNVRICYARPSLPQQEALSEPHSADGREPLRLCRFYVTYKNSHKYYAGNLQQGEPLKFEIRLNRKRTSCGRTVTSMFFQ